MFKVLVIIIVYTQQKRLDIYTSVKKIDIISGFYECFILLHSVTMFLGVLYEQFEP